MDPSRICNALKTHQTQRLADPVYQDELLYQVCQDAAYEIDHLQKRIRHLEGAIRHLEGAIRAYESSWGALGNQ